MQHDVNTRTCTCTRKMSMDNMILIPRTDATEANIHMININWKVPQRIPTEEIPVTPHILSILVEKLSQPLDFIRI